MHFKETVIWLMNVVLEEERKEQETNWKRKIF